MQITAIDRSELMRKTIADVAVGDLLMLVHGSRHNSSNDQPPVLGVFADFLYDNICFAEQPHRLKVTQLPSGLYQANFIPISESERGRGYYLKVGGREIKRNSVIKWDYTYTNKMLRVVTSGKDNILRTLREYPGHVYDGHAEVIERMQKPYVNDLKIRKRLRLSN
jgi:hypothetical protein